jgi:hypothetical protein
LYVSLVLQLHVLTWPQVPVWEKYAEKMAHDENPEYMNLKKAGAADAETRRLHVGFDGQLGTHVSHNHLS